MYFIRVYLPSCSILINVILWRDIWVHGIYEPRWKDDNFVQVGCMWYSRQVVTHHSKQDLLPTRPWDESLFTDRDGIYYVAYSLKSLWRRRPLGHHLSIDKISPRNGSRHLFGIIHTTGRGAHLVILMLEVSYKWENN